MRKLLLAILMGVCFSANASQYYSDYQTIFTSPDAPLSNDPSIIIPPNMPIYFFLNTTTHELYYSDSKDTTNLTYHLLITSDYLLANKSRFCGAPQTKRKHANARRHHSIKR